MKVGRSERRYRARAALRGAGRRDRRDHRHARARRDRAAARGGGARAGAAAAASAARGLEAGAGDGAGRGRGGAGADAPAAAASLRAVRHLRRPRRRVRDAGNGTATARFSDGTSIAVGAHSAARVRARTRAGATIRLDRGQASFAVVAPPRRQLERRGRPVRDCGDGHRVRCALVGRPRRLRGRDEVGHGRRARLADGRRDPPARRTAAGGVAGEQDAGRQRGRPRRAVERRAGDGPGRVAPR